MPMQQVRWVDAISHWQNQLINGSIKSTSVAFEDYS